MGERATSPQNEAPSPDTGQDPWGPRPPRARPAPAPCSWQYRSRLLKRALRMSTAMRSPMRDSSTRYPKVSRPWERGGALRGARGDFSLCAQALPPAVPGGHRG